MFSSLCFDCLARWDNNISILPTEHYWNLHSFCIFSFWVLVICYLYIVYCISCILCLVFCISSIYGVRITILVFFQQSTIGALRPQSLLDNRFTLTVRYLTKEPDIWLFNEADIWYLISWTLCSTNMSLMNYIFEWYSSLQQIFDWYLIG